MKAWIYICAIVLVAGRVMVLAEEPKTNTAPGTAIPSPATSTPTNPAPAQPKITTVPRTPNAVTPSETGGHKGALTNPPTASTSAPAVTNEARSPDETSLTPTSAVPAEAVSTTPLPPTNATPPSESSGISNLAALAVGLVILVLAIGLAFFMWRRSHAFPHGSLITSAMNELKHSGKNEDKDEEKHEEKQEETPIEEPAEKKPEKKFPPPMT